MEYYAAVPKIKAKTRSRGKNRRPGEDGDDYSFAPIANLEIRRNENCDGSPSRTKPPKDAWKQTIRAVSWIIGINVSILLVFTRRHFASMGRLLAGSRTPWRASALWAEESESELRMEMRQKVAQLALNRQQEQHVFDSAVTSYQSVMEHSFPRRRKRCTIQRAFERRGQHPLKLVILGGAGSARPAEDCSGEDGLYSNRLEKALNDTFRSASLPFSIVNMAQEKMLPSVQALLLDQFVDVHSTDILIWEQARIGSKGADHYYQELDLFLARVAAHFGQAGLPPPPIIVLHLWDEIVARAKPSLQHSTSPNKSEEPVIDRYLAQDWNIQVINAGNAISHDKLQVYPRELWDLTSQPNCRAVELISDMIQSIIYQDLVSCSPTLEADGTRMKEAAAYSTVDPPLSRNTTLRLSELLVRRDIRVGSLNHWKPAIDSVSFLKVNNTNQAAQYLERIPATPTAPWNNPRSTQPVGDLISYRVPPCSKWEYLNLTLAEPNLIWLGLVYNGGRLEASLNGESLLLEHDGIVSWGREGIRDWVHLPQLATQEYILSMCSRKINKEGKSTVWLNQLVGVMLSDCDAQSWGAMCQAL